MTAPTTDALDEITSALPENLLRPRIVLQRGSDDRPLEKRWYAVLQDVDDVDDLERNSALGAADSPVDALFALAAQLRARRVAT